AAGAVAAVATGACAALYWLLYLHDTGDLSNLTMVYLLGVAFVAIRHGRLAAAFTAALSVFAFDFLFVPPVFELSLLNAQYLFTFTAMMAIGVLIGTLA